LNVLGNMCVANLICVDHPDELWLRLSCSSFFTVMTSLFLPANLPIQLFLFVSIYPMPPVLSFYNPSCLLSLSSFPLSS
jgi:hypothetical protein